MTADNALAPFVLKLARRSELGADGVSTLLSLPHHIRHVQWGATLAREGEQARHYAVLLSGFAFSSRTCANGARAVLALHMEGEPLDISVCASAEAPCDVQALTPVTVAKIPRSVLHTLAQDDALVAQALWRLAARGSSVLGEWLVNVGRRNARGRVSHLICEIATRQKVLDANMSAEYVMPLTQEQLGDCTGLTPVHVNRVIQDLRREKLLGGAKRDLKILDWAGLTKTAEFRPDYLRLPA